MISSNSCYIFGYSGHSYVVIDSLYKNNILVSGYYDKIQAEKNPYNIDYFGSEENENLINKTQNNYVFPTVGDNLIRKKLVLEFLKLGLKQFILIDTSAVLSKIGTIGVSTYIAPNVVLNSSYSVGMGCIINTGAIIEHECTIGDFTHIAPGCILCGNVEVGENCFIGANSTIKEGVKVGNNVIIGAGSIILKDVIDNSKIIGNQNKNLTKNKIKISSNSYDWLKKLKFDSISFTGDVSVLSIDDDIEWQNLLDKLPLSQQDIYYSPGYYKMHYENGDGFPICIVFKINNELILYPFLINAINALGYKLQETYYDIQGAYGYNGIVSSTNNQKFVNQFYVFFNQFCLHNNIVAEFTRFNPIIENHHLADSAYEISKNRKTLIINLKDSYENIWMNSYSTTNRNIIRKTISNNLVANIYTDLDQIIRFKDLYYETMTNVDANKYYFFNENYFKSLVNDNVDRVFLFTVEKDEKLVSSILILIYKNYAHYHLSGRTMEYSKLNANNFLLNEAVKFAMDKNCTIFHLGGGRGNEENDQLLKFKANFSKSEKYFFIGKKIFNTDIYTAIQDQFKILNSKAHRLYNKQVLGYRN